MMRGSRLELIAAGVGIVMACGVGGAEWEMHYQTCAYVFVPSRVDGNAVDYARVEYGALARRGQQGLIENAHAHSQHLELLGDVHGGYGGYVAVPAEQHSASNEFDVGVYARKIIVFKDGTRTAMPQRVYYFARPEAGMVVCGELEAELDGDEARSAAATALAEVVQEHQELAARTDDVLFVARWGGVQEPPQGKFEQARQQQLQGKLGRADQ
jgi:hypothetical protein